MDVLIRYGFGNITHNILFEPQKKIKGKKLVEAGHVKNVEEIRRSTCDYYLIKASVLKQTAENYDSYQTCLHVSKLLINY